MGRVMQKRLVRKLDLELALSKIQPYSEPAPDLEQYTISADVAATMLYIAAYSHGNIVNKRVVDLGCGTGRLAMGAALLGAKEVVGVDIDRNAVEVASNCAEKFDLRKKTQWIITDIDSVNGHFDTVLQNPPFGVQKRGADRKFVVKALELSNGIYSLHKRPDHDSALLKELKTCSDGAIQVSSSSFMERFVEENGGTVDSVYALLMTIPHMFSFHSQKKHEFVVDLYVLRKK
ncbi:METTL5 family protein [Candidatus Bathyarchaeota archaeon]|nr:METTL5 family protein [Candidatus Bathyarchaeota archaeon]